jgi:hypothetical protein
MADFCYVRFGFVDPRADLPVGWLESKIAMLPSMPQLTGALQRFKRYDIYPALVRFHVLSHASRKPVFGLAAIQELNRHG